MTLDPMPDVPGTRFVYRPWRRCPRTGQKLWAKTYGFKAWRIPVDDEPPKIDV